MNIPAKTFFLGEYAVLNNAPALIALTSPCFSFVLTPCENFSLGEIHPLSPAGKLALDYQADLGDVLLDFHDPYSGLGGLGASTAQFLAVFKQLNPSYSHDALLQSYFHYAWDGKGTRPSGADLIAQDHKGLCFYQKEKTPEILSWPFESISFLLLRSNQKLATHKHLSTLNNTIDTVCASDVVRTAFEAIKQNNALNFITSINEYGDLLETVGLQAPHTLKAKETLIRLPGVKAFKGCGAMGADIFLIIYDKSQEIKLLAELKNTPYPIAADERALFNT